METWWDGRRNQQNTQTLPRSIYRSIGQGERVLLGEQHPNIIPKFAPLARPTYHTILILRPAPFRALDLLKSKLWVSRR